MNLDENETEETVETQRFCRKCGEPITSNSKYNLCENCRRTYASALRSGAKVVGIVGLTVLTLSRLFKRK